MVRLWESTLAIAMLVDVDLAGRQLGIAKDSQAGLSSRIKLRAEYKRDCNCEKAKGRALARRLPQHMQLEAKMARMKVEIRITGPGWQVRAGQRIA